MDLTKELAKLTREELHKKVWSTPCSKLAEEFGLSDVAIAKRCKKLDVPRPSRGYWAKLQAGLKPRRIPLPPTQEEVFARVAEKDPVRRRLPRAKEDILSPLAAEFLAALKKCKNRWDRRIHLKEPTLPEATVSPALAERSAQAFHVILLGTEAVGLPFLKSRSRYEGGDFRMGRDQLFFAIEEDLVAAPERLSGRGRQPTYSAYGESRVPCGSLSFKITNARYGRDYKRGQECILDISKKSRRFPSLAPHPFQVFRSGSSNPIGVASLRGKSIAIFWIKESCWRVRRGQKVLKCQEYMPDPYAHSPCLPIQATNR